MTKLSRPRFVAGALLLLIFGALGFLSPLSQPNYESALAAGLLCPIVAAIVTARELLPRRLSAFGSLCRAVATGGGLVVLVYLLLLVHGLRTGLCDLAKGTELFILGPGLGTVLGSVWGGVSAELSRRWFDKRKATGAVLLAICGPLSCIVMQLALFYATPAVFAYDPFVGYFAGPLYDTVFDTLGLRRYRLSTLCTLTAVYVLSLHLERQEDGEGWRYRSLKRPGLLFIGGLCAVQSGIDVARGPQLNHWQTAGTITEALGGQQQFGRCQVIFDQTIPPAELKRFGQDCHGHVMAIGDWLNISDTYPLTVYLFESAAQKRRLMGAGRTSIAKPWRREIYLQRAPYPHPVMGHELVHAMASTYGEGPFGVAGPGSGWLPNPGLVEGLAVAASPPRGDLEPHRWAAAMRRIKVLARLDHLFGLGFLTSNSSAAYTAAGSFVDFIRERYGAQVIVQWYGGAKLTSLSKRSWAELEEAWWHMLDEISLAPNTIKQAQARFDRPGVLARRCPHVVDEELAQASDQLHRGAIHKAEAGFQRVLRLDPANGHAKLSLARCQERLGNVRKAETILTSLSQSDYSHARTKQRALETAGDLALRAKKVSQARSLYERVREVSVDTNRLRTLDIKEHYADQSVARTALVALLIGTTVRGPLDSETMDYLGRWRSEAGHRDGTPDYLLARQHLATSSYALALARLRDALSKPIPLPRVREEAWRLSIIAACAKGDHHHARHALAQYQNQPLSTRARQRWAKALVHRCTQALP